MEVSETIKLLKEKILKIFSFLLLIRLGLYIPVPNVDLDIFSQNQVANPLFGLAKNLTGSSFLGIGSLGILLLTQITLGIINVVYVLPLYVAIAHNLVAALLLLATFTINYLAWKK